jgi:hypothetical protein
VRPRQILPIGNCQLAGGGTYDARDPELAGHLSKLLDRRVSVLDTPPDGLVLER